ncbi:MAG TPA: hypothetical protein VFO49_15225 [Nocardioides sp.]|nr:hypothetical protein [Nocardioides sp.]
MSTDTWHAGPDLLRRYADAALDDVGQAAVETHVTRCADCRREATALVAEPALETVWQGVTARVRAPRTHWTLRVLRRLGVPEPDLVVLRNSANLLLALAIATMAAVGFAIAGSFLKTSSQEVFYLALAPLLPTLLVAGAYDSTDPLRELAEPTPFGKLRIALLRTTIAVVGALPLVVLMGLVPHIDTNVATWLLPSLALTVLTLVLLTWLRAPLAVGAVVTAWLLVVTGLRTSGEVELVADPAGQLLAAAVLVAASVTLIGRLGVLRPERGVR